MVTSHDSYQPYLNGKNPPIIMCMPVLWCQETDGISLAMFLVRHGALKLLDIFLPKIPPIMVNGKPTTVHYHSN